MLELNTVAIKLAGRYSVATNVKAFIVLESFSLSLLRKVRILLCPSNVPKVLDMAVLVRCICSLVRKSRILCSCHAQGKSARDVGTARMYGDEQR